MKMGRGKPLPIFMFYTYIHFKADTNEPFYIGKGQGRRHLIKSKRNNHWNNVVRKHGFKSEILCKWENEHDALEHEKLLIQCFKDMGIPLVNMTDGGEGTSGWSPSDAWREKKSASQKSKFVNPMFDEQSRKKSAQTRTGMLLSSSHKARISQSLIGNKSRTGMLNTAESNAKRSETMKAFWASKKSSQKESS
jgi:hypothetical protein